MSLMFFLSGLFVWHSLARKGSAKFLRDRLLRLGIPFVVAATILAPLAYYPAYLRTASHTGVAGYWHQWRGLGNWPAGPAWFVWVLLTFDLIATLLFVIAPGWGESLGRVISGVSRRPVVFFAGLVAISAIAYIPMALIFTSTAWAAFGRRRRGMRPRSRTARSPWKTCAALALVGAYGSGFVCSNRSGHCPHSHLPHPIADLGCREGHRIRPLLRSVLLCLSGRIHPFCTIALPAVR